MWEYILYQCNYKSKNYIKTINNGTVESTVETNKRWVLNWEKNMSGFTIVEHF